MGYALLCTAGLGCVALYWAVPSCADPALNACWQVNIMRKIRHPNIVALLGIGARDLTDLCTMRSSMYVVIEVRCHVANSLNLW